MPLKDAIITSEYPLHFIQKTVRHKSDIDNLATRIFFPKHGSLDPLPSAWRE